MTATEPVETTVDGDGQAHRNGTEPAAGETADTAGAGADGYRYTDLGNARRLVAAHATELRYVPIWRCWLTWTGGRWTIDDDRVAVSRAAASIGRRLLGRLSAVTGPDRAALFRWVQRSESSTAVNATVQLARTLPGITVHHNELDRLPWLVVAANDTVDIQGGPIMTATAMAHDPDHLMTKMAGAAYDPDAASPLFDRFLEDILPDPDVRGYIQRFAGYSLTGTVTEQVLPVWWGDGANGKSTLVSILAAVWGDYARPFARELLAPGRHDHHPTALADLFRVRLAFCVEPKEFGRLDESRIKMLTGNDRIKARRMREDFWEFDPTAKLVVVTNHKPRIAGTDHAIWRRVHLVPFTVTISNPDRTIGDRIIATELPGILNWAIAGCLQWQRQGLDPPDAVIAATETWRTESDTVAAFITECLVHHPDANASAAAIHTAYGEWCQREGIADHERFTTTALAKRLATIPGTHNRGDGGPRRNRRWWYGIGLHSPLGDTAP